MRVLITDIGYGDTKYWYQSDEEHVKGKIPTLIAPVNRLVDQKGPGKKTSYRYGDKLYLVGDEARYASHIIMSTTKDFIPSYSPLMVARIASGLSLEEEESPFDLLVVSLSIKDWFLSNRMVEVLSKFVVNGCLFSQKVEVFPQGLGIWVEAGARDNIMIVDIGYNTVDVAVFVDGELNPDLSFAIRGFGAIKFISEIAEHLNSNSNEEFTPNEICYMLQKSDSFFERMGVKNEAKACAVDWFQVLWERLNARESFRKAALYMDICISGGGARFAKLIELPSYVEVMDTEPEFANVNGFAKFIASSEFRMDF